MPVLALVRKDLRRVLADRRALAVNMVLPLLLSFVMGLSFGGGFFGRGGPTEVPVALVGEGLPQQLRDGISEAMDKAGFFTTSWTDSTEADRRVRTGEAAAAVVLPTDFTTRFFRGDTVAIAVWQDPGSPLTSGIVAQILERMLARYQAGEAAYLALWPEDGFEADQPGELRWSEVLDGGFSELWSRWRGAEADPQLRGAAERFVRSVDHNVALGRAMSADGVVLAARDKAPAAEAAGNLNLYDTVLPGFAVFFLLFGAAASARDIHRERDRGTLQRQLLGPVTDLQFLLGKWLAAALQGAVQLGVLFAAGASIFGVNLGPDAWSLPVMVVLGAAAASAFFTLMAVVTPTEKVMDNLSTVIVLVAAMLGGNMIPVDALPDWVRMVGQFFFNYWINLGMQGVIARDVSLGAAPLPALVLATFTMAGLAASLVVFGVRRRRGGLA